MSSSWSSTWDKIKAPGVLPALMLAFMLTILMLKIMLKFMLTITLMLLSAVAAVSDLGHQADSGLLDPSGHLQIPGGAEEQVQGEPRPGGSEETPEEETPELVCVLQDVQVRRQRLHEVQRRNLLAWAEEQQQRSKQSCSCRGNLQLEDLLLRLR